jgi:cysteine desulfurase
MANGDSSRNRIVMSGVEHHCVLRTRPLLERLGYRLDLAPVDRIGRISLDALRESIGPDVLLVSVMHANNELGTTQPASEVARIAHSQGAVYHADAVQTFLHTSWTVATLGADIVSMSAHKVNGPKGVGAIYTRAGIKLQPLTVGGGQEREMRAGTENVAGIVGFAAAVRTHAVVRAASTKAASRKRFLEKLDVPGLVKTVPMSEDALSGHAHCRIPGIDAETMLILLDRRGVSASSGAACSSGSLEPSHVLLACGYSLEESKEGLRFTFGDQTTIGEAEEAARRVSDAAAQIRSKR